MEYFYMANFPQAFKHDFNFSEKLVKKKRLR